MLPYVNDLCCLVWSPGGAEPGGDVADYSAFAQGAATFLTASTQEGGGITATRQGMVRC